MTRSEDEETYRVPLIDAVTGEEWDVEVEAESPQEAIQKAVDSVEHGDVQVASTFIRDHMEIDP